MASSRKIRPCLSRTPPTLSYAHPNRRQLRAICSGLGLFEPDLIKLAIAKHLRNGSFFKLPGDERKVSFRQKKIPY
jgi:hypothetical protein